MAIKIRASSLPALLGCPKMWMEKTSHDGDTLGGPEAQTGNLVHCGMAAFHASKAKTIQGRITDGVKAIKQSKLEHYVGGDLATAESLFHSWSSQEQKASKGKVVGSEIELRYKWPVFYSAAEYQAYVKAKKVKPIPQEEMTITGHTDEVRMLDDVLYICDEKTGWTPADRMTGEYAAQIAGYVVGIHLSGMFPEITKYRGYIKRTRDIGTSDPYYYKVINDLKHAYSLMYAVSLRAGEIAQGVYLHTPGSHCRNCPLDGFPNCLDGIYKPVKPSAVNQVNSHTKGTKAKKRAALPLLNPPKPLTPLIPLSFTGNKPKKD